MNITPELHEDIDWILQNLKDEGYAISSMGLSTGPATKKLYRSNTPMYLRIYSSKSSHMNSNLEINPYIKYFYYSEVYDILEEAIGRLRDLGFQFVVRIVYGKQNDPSRASTYTIYESDQYDGAPPLNKFKDCKVAKIELDLYDAKEELNGRFILPTDLSKVTWKNRIKKFFEFS